VTVERDGRHWSSQLRQGAATISRRQPAAEDSMSKRRWPILLVPPLILVLAFLALTRSQPGVEAARPGILSLIRACSSPGVVTSSVTARPGTWWKTADRLDANGTLLGRRLSVGRGASVSGSLDLPAESSVSGPLDGLVVAVADDGARSSVQVIEVGRDCGLVIHESQDVVRTAILDPRSRSVLAHVVDRATRADLGTWRLALGPAGATEARLAAPPLDAAAVGMGTVWATDLRLDATGSRLAIQSCADLGCVTRVLDLDHPASAPTLIRGVTQGPMLGFAGSNLVTWAACPGYPCPVIAWSLRDGASHQLLPGTNAAALTADGRRLVALVTEASGQRALELDPSTGRTSGLHGLAAGARPLRMGPSADAGLEVAPDEIALASDGAESNSLNPDSAADEVIP
jgi:hypothetical protein